MPPDDEFGPANHRRRQLGRRLQQLRKDAGYTLKIAESRSGLSTASISRIENGNQTILPRNVRTLCQAYGVGQPELDHLVRLAEESEDRGWLVEYSLTVPNWFARYVSEEDAAAEIWTFQPLCVPGLLQTEAYTRALMTAARPNVEASSLDSSLAFRRRRQERLSGDEPPRVFAVIDESVVRRVVGGRRVMAEQLFHLVELGQRDNVTIQILPFGAGEHPAMIAAFNMLHFIAENARGLDDASANDDRPTIYFEVYGGAVYPDGPDDVDHVVWMWRRLRDLALSPDDSLPLLTRLAMELQNPGD